MFENLKVYQMSVDLADDVIQLSDAIFKRGNFAIADQLRRASISIPSNIAEGNGRYHPADRRRFLYIARGSGFELVPLLDLSVRRGYLDESERKRLLEKLTDICKILTAMAKT